MGTYDVLETGDQVKCFPVVLYNPRTRGLWVSGGALRSFRVGDAVPWKTAFYDHGRDFHVLDSDPSGPFDGDGYVMHTFLDGRYAGTVTSEDVDAGRAEFPKIVGKVVTYRGDVALRVRGREDAEAYSADLRAHAENLSRIRTKSYALMRRFADAARGIASPEVGTDERAERDAELERISASLEAARAEEAPDVEAATRKMDERWIVPGDGKDVLELGAWLEAAKSASRGADGEPGFPSAFAEALAGLPEGTAGRYAAARGLDAESVRAEIGAILTKATVADSPSAT